MKKIVFAVLVLFTIIGCGDDDNNYSGSNNTPVAIAFTEIADGARGNSSIPSGNYVIRTEAEWNAFKEETGMFSEIPINFTINEVIVVFDEYRESLGYDIEITSISKFDNNLTVKITKTAPSPDEGTLTMQEQPYHAVKIQRSGLPVIFEVNAPI